MAVVEVVGGGRETPAAAMVRRARPAQRSAAHHMLLLCPARTQMILASPGPRCAWIAKPSMARKLQQGLAGVAVEVAGWLAGVRGAGRAANCHLIFTL